MKIYSYKLLQLWLYIFLKSFIGHILQVSKKPNKALFPIRIAKKQYIVKCSVACVAYYGILIVGNSRDM